MSTDAQVERACRAICKSEGTAQCAAICLSYFASSTSDGKCPEAVLVWGRKVRAVLAAAEAERGPPREPTEEMIEAGAQTRPDYCDNYLDEDEREEIRERAAEIWTAMHDAWTSVRGAPDDADAVIEAKQPWLDRARSTTKAERAPATGEDEDLGNGPDGAG
jgi:hypothetical protein